MLIRFDFAHLVTDHCRGGGVGAVRCVRDDHDITLGIAAILVVRLDEQQACQFTVCARRRLECVSIHTRDIIEQLFQTVEELKVTLDGAVGLQGMRCGKACKRRHILVNLRVIFHRAGAQRIRTHLDVVVFVRHIGVMANHRNFVHIGDIGLFSAIGFAKPF